MKIYIVHVDLLNDVDKHFGELTDQEVVDLCAKDVNGDNHDVYESVEEMSAYWNMDEIFNPTSAYMRVIKDPECVYVFTAEQVWDGEVDLIVKTFDTREAARKYMHAFLHDSKDESVAEYVERVGLCCDDPDDPDYYLAYNEGYYPTNHVECMITKCEIEK